MALEIFHVSGKFSVSNPTGGLLAPTPLRSIVDSPKSMMTFEEVVDAAAAAAVSDGRPPPPNSPLEEEYDVSVVVACFENEEDEA